MARDQPDPAADSTAEPKPKVARILTSAPVPERTRLGSAVAILLLVMAIGAALVGFDRAYELAEQARQADAATRIARDEAEAAKSRESATQDLLATAKTESSKLAEQLTATQQALADVRRKLTQQLAATQQALADEQRKIADFEATRESERDAFRAAETKRWAEQVEVANQRAAQALAEKRKAQFSEGAALTNLSKLVLQEGSPADAVKLALAAWPRKGDADRPALKSTYEALTSGLGQLKQRELLAGHTDQVWSVSHSPDGKRLVTASWDGTARIWDVASGAVIAVLQGHQDKVWSAVFSPDGSRILTASSDRTARLWDAQTGKEVSALTGSQDVVFSAAFSPDGTRIVTASWDQTARIWDAATGAQLAVLRHAAKVWCAAFSPDGAQVVTGVADNTARIWDAKTGAEQAVLAGHEAWVTRAMFSPDGKRVLTASEDNTARLWDVATGSIFAILPGHVRALRDAVYSPDGTRIATASFDKAGRVWRAQTGTEWAEFTGHEGIVMSVDFSPDGKRIVTASQDRTARVWDAATGAQLLVLDGHTGPVLSAIFLPDGIHVATASEDKTARIWDVSMPEVSDAIAVACTFLGNDTDLARVRTRFGLGDMVPVCGSNPPQRVEVSTLE